MEDEESLSYLFFLENLYDCGILIFVVLNV